MFIFATSNMAVAVTYNSALNAAYRHISLCGSPGKVTRLTVSSVFHSGKLLTVHLLAVRPHTVLSEDTQYQLEIQKEEFATFTYVTWYCTPSSVGAAAD